MGEERENTQTESLHTKGTNPQQLQTDNVFTYLENPNHTDKRNMLLACVLWTISRRIERMPQENKTNVWLTI